MHCADPARAVTRALLWRVGGLVFAVAVSAALLFTLLARLHFANVNARLTAERLAVLAERSVAPFSAAARLGLPLDSVRNASGLLERARLADDAILALWVVDPQGRFVHGIGEPLPEGALPAAWQRARHAAEGQPWHLSDGDRLVAGSAIPGRDGAGAGSLVVLYPGQGERLMADAMLVDLARAALLASAFALLVAVLLLRPVLRPTIAALQRLAMSHAAFQRGEWRGVALADEPAVARADPLVQDLHAAAVRYRAASAPPEGG